MAGRFCWHPHPGSQDHRAKCAGLGGAAAADHHADRRGRAAMPGDHRHWPARRGQNDGPSAVGSGRTRDGVLDLSGRLQQSVRRLLVLCRRGAGPVRSRPSQGVVGCFAPAAGRPYVPGAARVAAVCPEPAGVTGRRRPAYPDRADSTDRARLRPAERAAGPAPGGLLPGGSAAAPAPLPAGW